MKVGIVDIFFYGYNLIVWYYNWFFLKAYESYYIRAFYYIIVFFVVDVFICYILLFLSFVKHFFDFFACFFHFV